MVLIGLILFVSGCATTYRVRTNSFVDKTDPSSQIRPGSTFTVLTNPSAPNPIFEDEMKRKIEASLADQGYKIGPEDQADYLLTFQYDISAHSETDSYPDYRTGPAIAQRVFVSGGNRSYTVISPGLSYTTYSVRTRTVYTAKLFVKVLDGHAQSGQKEKTVWVGESMNESTNPDLRDSIDYLLVGTFRVFGKDTGKSREVVIDEKDPAVQRFSRVGTPPVYSSPKASS
jgi:hypothetical protein